MTIEILTPEFGESITEATVAEWLKKPGDEVEMDEPLVALETDKVTLEVPAPATGILREILAQDGETVEVGAILARMEEGDRDSKTDARPASRRPAPRDREARLSPSARVIAETHHLNPAALRATGPRGGITKADALRAVPAPQSAEEEAPSAAPPAPRGAEERIPSSAPPAPQGAEERIPMSRIRQTIARRLKEAQNSAAMLTTFNEADMSELIALRAAIRDMFEAKYGVRPGFMGFFVKACCAALEEIPEVNAQIEGGEIVYRRYANIGVAVGTDRGLVVPVLARAERMSLARIEKTIALFAAQAREGKLPLQALTGGTFTISNGGVYGSLLSTPILNAPQSGVLGMHKIQERPVAINGKVEVRPMMYLALTYDHRLVDGREAVTFLAGVKERIENPAQILMENAQR